LSYFTKGLCIDEKSDEIWHRKEKEKKKKREGRRKKPPITLAKVLMD
jgi:hypothetical protein